MNILRPGVTMVDRKNLRLDAIGADETSLVISLGHPTELEPNPGCGLYFRHIKVGKSRVSQITMYLTGDQVAALREFLIGGN